MASFSLRPFPASLASDFTDVGLTTGRFSTNFGHSGFRKSASLKRNQVLRWENFELNCSIDREMDLSTSALIDGVSDSLNADIELKEPSISTLLMNFGDMLDPYEAISTPLYQTATFKQPSATENGPYDYTRSGNPTRDVLESLLAKLDKADRAFCFTSGMAALSAVAHLVGTSEEIVAGDDIYGGSDRLLSKVIPKTGVVVKRVDTTSLDEIAYAIGPWTKLVWLESPTNPRQMVSNIREIVKMAHPHDALVLVDNSIMSPVVSQPLELGADIVMHSATKFITGHSDVMAGVLAVRSERLAKELYFLQNVEGSGLAPFDCWLCLRGIKTMALRIEKQQCGCWKTNFGNRFLVYGGAGNEYRTVDIEGFVDSYFAGCLEIRKSLTGYVFAIFGTSVSWKASLQKMVALSTTEAEHIALTEVVKEAIWLEGLARELKIQDKVITVHYDKQSAIHLSKNQVYYERTKHVDIKLHFVR
ncbi:cystathionine beta-lyase, chloroplastic-like [Humulus lupulus]|uniref:cystathionine beta-lyase, chloroplastic-like n=1 Tax=Humulus lupulus TaxID=3486 RepID=UPI002B404FF3|nr:cystathionine beta-lyase, chloroplastic-like [Humulus lupulus]